MQHWASPTRSRPIRFQGTPQTITAIANNELEVANLAYSSLAIAIDNAGLDDLRVIADEFQDGVPGYYSEEYCVRKDSGINKVEDLKGKVIGTNGGGSAVDVAVRAMLQKARPRGQARLHHAGRPAAGHAGDAAWKRRPISSRPCCLSRSIPSCAPRARCCSTWRTRIGTTQMIMWSRASRSSKAPRRHGRFHGGHADASCTGISTRRTTTRWPRSRPRSPRRRPSASAGCSPRTTTIAIRT